MGKNKEELEGAIIWDILIAMLTIMLSTINNLTYIFMVASIILLFPIYRDLRLYKHAEGYSEKVYKLGVFGGVYSLVAVGILVSLVATNKVILTYILYGVCSPMLLVMIVFACKDAIAIRKRKQSQPAENEVNVPKQEFNVTELGTSLDREKNNTAKVDYLDIPTEGINNETNSFDNTEIVGENDSTEVIDSDEIYNENANVEVIDSDELDSQNDNAEVEDIDELDNQNDIVEMAVDKKDNQN